MFGSKWEKGKPLNMDNFICDGVDTFIFPDDLDFLGEISNCDYFINVFNDMITKRGQKKSNG